MEKDFKGKRKPLSWERVDRAQPGTGVGRKEPKVQDCPLGSPFGGAGTAQP